MVRLNTFSESERAFFEGMPMPNIPDVPGVGGGPLSKRRVAIVTTAGLTSRTDPRFGIGSSDYRVIRADTTAEDLIMSHASINYDRSGFQQDLNVVFPIDRLNELAELGTIGSVAEFHYSFMGVTHPDELEKSAENLSVFLKKDSVDAVLLTPV